MAHPPGRLIYRPYKPNAAPERTTRTDQASDAVWRAGAAVAPDRPAPFWAPARPAAAREGPPVWRLSAEPAPLRGRSRAGGASVQDGRGSTGSAHGARRHSGKAARACPRRVERGLPSAQRLPAVGRRPSALAIGAPAAPGRGRGRRERSGTGAGPLGPPPRPSSTRTVDTDGTAARLLPDFAHDVTSWRPPAERHPGVFFGYARANVSRWWFAPERDRSRAATAPNQREPHSRAGPPPLQVARTTRSRPAWAVPDAGRPGHDEKGGPVVPKGENVRMGDSKRCVFCEIVKGERPAHVVLDAPDAMAFLDARPLFKGHTLLVPRTHYETLTDLPGESLGPFFGHAQRLASAMESVLGAAGSFVALNNRVSQSVPHLHVHVVPRNRKDGLRGFFWPRQKYDSDAEAAEYATRLSNALANPA